MKLSLTSIVSFVVGVRSSVGEICDDKSKVAFYFVSLLLQS